MTWSEAFAAYLERNKIPRHEAAAALGVAPSTVHYWVRSGAEPRGAKGRDTKARVEVWTHGEVSASPHAPPVSTSTLTADETKAAG